MGLNGLQNAHEAYKIGVRFFSMELSLFAQAWPLLDGGTYEQLGFGRSHWTRVIRTSDQSFVLRVYDEHTTLAKIRYELALLKELQDQALPFAIPTPIPNRHEQFLTSIQGDGGRQWAILWQYIVGENANFSNSLHAYEAGKALGHLARALNDLSCNQDLIDNPNPSYQQLLIGYSKNLALLDDLPMDNPQHTKFVALIQEMLSQSSDWYTTLPQQIIHNDFIPGNILVDGSTISGIVDFESTRLDLRIMDLVVALCHWPYDLFGTGAEWPIIDALGKGYALYRPLHQEESQNLPQLVRLRWTINVLYFARRYLQGALPARVFKMFLEGALRNEQWVAKNGAELIQRARDW